METLVKKELKQVSLRQALVNAVIPTSSLSLIMFGLGIEVEKVFESKWLLTEPNRLGFSISSDEATWYKQSVVCIESVLEFLKINLKESFTQWLVDNVDHNFCTIDGKSTLRGVGIVVSTTPGRHAQSLKPISRQKRRAAKEIVKGEEIPITELLSMIRLRKQGY